MSRTWNTKADEFVPCGLVSGGYGNWQSFTTGGQQEIWHASGGSSMMPHAMQQFSGKGLWNGWNPPSVEQDLEQYYRIVLSQKGGKQFGWAGWKGSPPYGWPLGGVGSGCGLGCLDSVPVPWRGKGVQPWKTFAAIWNLDPEVYGDGAVLLRALADIDLEPLAILRMLGVPGAFHLEYDDWYSATSAVLALDCVSPKRQVLHTLGGLQVRAAEWDSHEFRFKDNDVPTRVQREMFVLRMTS